MKWNRPRSMGGRKTRSLSQGVGRTHDIYTSSSGQVTLKINASHENDMKAPVFFCCCLKDKNNKTPWSSMLVGIAPAVSLSTFGEVFGAGLHFRRYVRSPSP